MSAKSSPTTAASTDSEENPPEVALRFSARVRHRVPGYGKEVEEVGGVYRHGTLQSCEGALQLAIYFC